MSIGELWVAHPLFPWIMIILAWWVLCSTVVMARNYVLIRRLERYNKLLQEMVVEGVRGISLVKRIPIPKSIGHTEECTSELCPEQSGIRIEEPEPAAIEETDENGDRDGDAVASTENEDKERASARST